MAGYRDDKGSNKRGKGGEPDFFFGGKRPQRGHNDDFGRDERPPRRDGAPQGKSYPPREGRPTGAPQNRPYPPRGDKPFPPREGRPTGAPQNRPYPPRGDKPFPPREGRPTGAPQNRPYPPRGDKPFPPREDRPMGAPQNRPYPPRGDRPMGRPFPPRPYPPREAVPPVAPPVAPAEEAQPYVEETVEAILLTGRNPIREALKAGRDIEKLLVARGDLSGSAREIVAKAREAGIVVQEVDRQRLDAIYPNHQGMIAYASAAKYALLEDVFALAEERGEPPFVVVLDGITDPHNLGAILRSAECSGAHGVIVPQRRSAGLTPAAVKAAAGAEEYVPVVKVVNISRTLDELKEHGLWIVASAMEGEDALEADLTGPIALVIGAEGEGISPLALKQCDRKVTLPMKGRIASLNASVAAGVMMYAVLAARRRA